MAHRRQKRRFGLVGGFGLGPRRLGCVGTLAQLGDQPRVLDRQHRLARQCLHQPDGLWRELSRRTPLQDERAEGAFLADQRDDQRGAVSGGEAHVAQRRARPLFKIGKLQWRALHHRLAYCGLVLGDVPLAE